MRGCGMTGGTVDVRWAGGTINDSESDDGRDSARAHNHRRAPRYERQPTT